MKELNTYFVSFRWDRQDIDGPFCNGFGNSTIEWKGAIDDMSTIRDIEEELCLENKVDEIIILNYIKLK